MGILYIVATPIGNLKDITFRAVETLQEVDFIFAEDTRITKKLLSRYDIHTPLLSYHQHSKKGKTQKILDLLAQGKNLALVTDAGTPGISDPGNELISFLVGSDPTIRILPIPGASALTALASVAGLPMDKFLFLGYPPHKKGRKKFFQEVAQGRHPVLFYESPHRIMKSLAELSGALDAGGKNQNTCILVGRELTKQFETIYRGGIENIQKELGKNPAKGEFVVLVHSDYIRARVW